jgi:hypothetical protein
VLRRGVPLPPQRVCALARRDELRVERAVLGREAAAVALDHIKLRLRGRWRTPTAQLSSRHGPRFNARRARARRGQRARRATPLDAAAPAADPAADRRRGAHLCVKVGDLLRVLAGLQLDGAVAVGGAHQVLHEPGDQRGRGRVQALGVAERLQLSPEQDEGTLVHERGRHGDRRAVAKSQIMLRLLKS